MLIKDIVVRYRSSEKLFHELSLLLQLNESYGFSYCISFYTFFISTTKDEKLYAKMQETKNFFEFIHDIISNVYRIPNSCVMFYLLASKTCKNINWNRKILLRLFHYTLFKMMKYYNICDSLKNFL